jgi:H+/Cl- antiporter ClcA
LSGSASALLLFSLDWVTQLFTLYNKLFWLLPVGGLVMWIILPLPRQRKQQRKQQLLIVYENAEEKFQLEWCFGFLGTLITHLLGGSAGREGTAVQMGGALANSIKNKKISKKRNLKY